MIPSAEEIKSIYAGIEMRSDLARNLQGWNSTNPLFARLIHQVRPKVATEVGVWNGASLLHMAEQSRCYNTVFFGIDAWFGHVGDRIGDPSPTPMPPSWKTPTNYDQFLFNVRMSGFHDRIIPVWQLSRWGAHCLGRWGVMNDLIYIDAAHEEEAVLSDLRIYWPTLRPGGVMFGDDYGDEWGVPKAVQRFSREVNVGFAVEGGQWYMNPK